MRALQVRQCPNDTPALQVRTRHNLVLVTLVTLHVFFGLELLVTVLALVRLRVTRTAHVLTTSIVRAKLLSTLRTCKHEGQARKRKHNGQPLYIEFAKGFQK